MKNAIILHGRPDKEEYYNPAFPSASNSHWIPWLQKQLLINDIETYTPEVFRVYENNYNNWTREFERYGITSETMLIGHSCGGGFLVRWLSENRNKRVDKVILVAPWIDPDREYTSDFFDFEIDTNLTDRTNGLMIFHSDDDMEKIKKTVAILREKIKRYKYKEFHKYGHFCYEDMKTAEFPELLDVCLNDI